MAAVDLDEIRQHHEPTVGALSDIGHVLGLMGVVLNALHGSIQEATQGQMSLLIVTATQAVTDAGSHIEPLWLAAGGKSA
jgi:hypothetical protein